jgi:C_GCAxxG_C_C family probable redox protein
MEMWTRRAGDRGETRLSRRRLLELTLSSSAAFIAATPAGARGARGSGNQPTTAPNATASLSTEDRVFLALTRFREGFHCSQSVLAAYSDGDRLPEDSALRMGAALAGGSTVGGECGAVAACYLVLGLRHAGTVPAFGEVEKERDLFDRIRDLVAEFRRRHGALTCRELLGVDVFTLEGLAEGRRRGLFSERCPRYIRDAITIIESCSPREPADPRPAGSVDDQALGQDSACA